MSLKTTSTSLVMHNNYYSIIESVDSISRDGPDTPIYIVHWAIPFNEDTPLWRNTGILILLTQLKCKNRPGHNSENFTPRLKISELKTALTFHQILDINRLHFIAC